MEAPTTTPKPSLEANDVSALARRLIALAQQEDELLAELRTLTAAGNREAVFECATRLVNLDGHGPTATGPAAPTLSSDNCGS